MIEKFARSMGRYLEKESFEGWLRVVAETKRKAAAASRLESSKHYLIKMMGQTQNMLLRVCFNGLRDVWLSEMTARHAVKAREAEVLEKRQQQQAQRMQLSMVERFVRSIVRELARGCFR